MRVLFFSVVLFCVDRSVETHHGKDARSRVTELEVLVGELHAVDGLAPGAVVLGEVASLTPARRCATIIALGEKTRGQLLTIFNVHTTQPFTGEKTEKKEKGGEKGARTARRRRRGRIARAACDGRRVGAALHEVGDDAVEGAALVAELLARSPDALLPRAQRAKVFARSGRNVGAKLEDDASDGYAADAHVEEASRQGRHRARVAS